MALDRQSIEKKDFPIGRRGYDPDAVDAHLSALANEIDELKRSARRRSESLAATASEQVRSIVEAAETTAADIQRQAEDEAREIRAEARTEAGTSREHATSEARDYVGKVAESTTGMLERIDAMEAELGALIESLRTGSNRLNADLQLLERNLSAVKNAVVPRPVFEPEGPVGARARGEAGAVPPPADEADAAPPPGDEAGAVPAPAVEAGAAPPPGDEAGAVPAPGSEAAAAPASALEQAAPAVPSAEPFGQSAGVAGAAAGEAPTDASAAPPPRSTNGAEDESARLIAANMVMNRTPREEIDRYLAENFKLTDRRGLLDDVYAAFGD